jgi:Tfp pilus assembly protein FimT
LIGDHVRDGARTGFRHRGPKQATGAEKHVRRTRRLGYTLLEITLVIALMVIFLALAAPSLEGLYGEVKTDAAADAYRSALVTARAHAIDEGRPYRVAVVPGTGNYRIAPDAPSFWNGSGESGSDAPAFVKEDVLPGGIVFATNEGQAQEDKAPSTDNLGSDSGRWSKPAIFFPDGTALADQQVTFHLEGSRTQVVKLRALTGSVTVGYLETANGQP